MSTRCAVHGGLMAHHTITLLLACSLLRAACRSVADPHLHCCASIDGHERDRGSYRMINIPASVRCNVGLGMKGTRGAKNPGAAYILTLKRFT